MSVIYFPSLTDAANWLEMKSANGDAEFVLAGMVDILKSAAKEPNADRRIASQAILNFLQNVANS